MQEHAPKGRVIVVNGFPGVGKLTILRELQKRLPADTTRLLDNHLLIDPVAALYPDRGPEHHELRRLVRAPIFRALRDLVNTGHTILLTTCLAVGNTADADFLSEHIEIVRGTDAHLFWFNLACNWDVLKERARSSERSQGSKSKLVNETVLHDLVDSHQLIEPPELVDGMRLTVKTLDVSGEVEASVEKLLEFIETRK